MVKNKKQMYIVIGAFALVLMLFTTTYAFFNYTRTGVANVIRTGRINFNSTQGTAINLTNIFPVDVSEGIPNDPTKVGSVTINVTGDTTYGEGVEYLVSAVNVSNTSGSGANAKQLPISIDVAVSSNTHGEAPNQTTTTLGTATTDYFEDRGSTTSYYQVLASDTIEDNSELVVGYIAPGAQGIDGNIVIRAYIDASKVAISDTYPEQIGRKVIVSGYSSGTCETVLTGVQNASTYCATASNLQDAIDNEDLTATQINALVVAGIVEEYTDGTTSSWVGDRVVFTTSEWNALQTNGVSFQVKVEANEGTWVEDPNRPICIRATTLHTEECNQSNDHCYADGYYLGGAMDTTTITYGNLGTSGNTPVVGDAFDCDVNGDGNYTERFYYVSPYYNTDTKTFDGTTSSDYATLIYYSNTVSGITSTNGSAYATPADAQAVGSCSVGYGCNWFGPLTAKTNLPTTSQWNNITLKNSERAILAEFQSTHNATSTSGGALPTNFSYEGYSARLLTAQELMNGCNLTQVGSSTPGELSANCKFLMEGTKYIDSTIATYGLWLENPNANNYSGVLSTYASKRFVSSSSAGVISYGARPAIDVPYSRLDY